MTSAVTLYGRTYLDAEVDVPISTLAEGKGKVDLDVRAVLGGFACNAARALCAILPAQTIHLVTVIARIDLPRLRDAVPPEVVLDPLVRDSLAWPPISVIVNPAGECKLLRGRVVDDEASWSIERVRNEALAAPLQVVGRVPEAFVGALVSRRSTGARIAWCGGAAISPALEGDLDLMCVNAAEAGRLLGTGERSPRDLAHALARRAQVPGALRLVTGRADAPPAVAVREGGSVVVHEGAVPAQLAATDIRRLKGVGDVFAARFLIAACLDDQGRPRQRVDAVRALAVAGDAAHAFITAASVS